MTLLLANTGQKSFPLSGAAFVGFKIDIFFWLVRFFFFHVFAMNF